MDDNLRYRARPDIMLKKYNQIMAIEFTCPYETYTEKSRELKKYGTKTSKTSSSLQRQILS